MTTTQPLPLQPPQQGGEQTLTAPLGSLSHPTTLWVPLDEASQQWATFAQEAITVSALLAIGSAFGGLAWETRALRHYAWAVYERERGRPRKEAHWLERAVQDLDCALDQWQQALSWLELAGDDDEQREQTSLDTIRVLIDQARLHQGRRRALHQQVLGEYTKARGHLRQQRRDGSRTNRASTSSESGQQEVP